MTDWDTRRDTRAPITVQVKVRVNPAMRETVQLAKEAVEAQMVDISLLGFGMTCSIYLPKGVLIDIQLPRTALATPTPPPEGASPAEGIMPITGQIMYTRPQDKLCRMGIVITQLSEPDKKLVEHFVSQNERRRAPRAPL